MTLEKEQALIEAVLLLETDPVNTDFLAKTTELSRDVVEEVILLLKEKYQQADRGFEIIKIGGGWVFSPKEELWEYLKEKYGKKNNNRLSKAGLETLSIIAYSQPITKGEIENIRGVNADNMIRLLISRELVKVVGKKDSPGRPSLYGTTQTFLEKFKLSSISDLPKLDEVEQEKFELK
ncbi:MAG: SMC-Scp complex subunit ScpB [Spirochaetales bacterium]|nr:SMC-Scp complex subunit ScpB [Spirochaetales bacterium]